MNAQQIRELLRRNSRFTALTDDARSAMVTRLYELERGAEVGRPDGIAVWFVEAQFTDEGQRYLIRQRLCWSHE